MSYQDILYEERDQIAYISINRPDVMNAFRGQTVEEMLHAMMKAGWDKNIAAIVLGGTLLLARVLHAVGMPLRAPNLPRALGTGLTWTVIGVNAVWLLFLRS